MVNMVTQNLAQRLLQQVACGVVALCSHTNRLVEPCADIVSGAESSRAHGSDVHIKSGGGFFAVGDIENRGAVGDSSPIAHLTAHFGVERSGIEDYNALVPLGNALYELTVHQSAERLSSTQETPFAEARASRARCFCSPIRVLNASSSTVMPLSSRMSSVRSRGKPKVS